MGKTTIQYAKYGGKQIGPGPKFGPGPILGPGPIWARAHFGPGSNLGPGPIWARDHLGPGPFGPGHYFLCFLQRRGLYFSFIFKRTSNRMRPYVCFVHMRLHVHEQALVLFWCLDLCMSSLSFLSLFLCLKLKIRLQFELLRHSKAF